MLDLRNNDQEKTSIFLTIEILLPPPPPPPTPKLEF